ncbi:MAG TPA: MFS transporter [Devosiaceae bacterium]|nr:MFS transporter [Devosiaceae bacterium]
MSLKPHQRLAACFFLFSCITGAMYSRMPDIQRALAVDEAQLGLTLIGAAVGSLISLTFSSPLIERLGARATGFITVIGSAICYASIAFISYAPLAFLVLFVAGLLAGALEINLNVQLGRLEVIEGRSLMSRAHGFWSLGFFCTSLVAAAIRQAGVPAPWHLAAVLVFIIVVGYIAISGMTDAPVPAAQENDKPPLIAFPNPSLLPLCLIGIAAFLIEGAGVDWSAIYMRNVFHAEPFIGGLGLTLFTAVMAAARIYLGPVVDHYSPRTVVTVLLSISMAGLFAVWLAPHPYVAIAGFAMLGGGCSAVYPLVVSAAAQRTDRPSAVNVAAIGQVSFIVFFLAPPLLGFVAHAVDIRWSYVVCMPVVIAAIFLVGALPARAKPEVPGTPLPEPLTPNG